VTSRVFRLAGYRITVENRKELEGQALREAARLAEAEDKADAT
jgi:hypothetical protein